MVRLCWRVGLLAIACWISSLQVKADEIVYSFATTASGTLGGTPFTNAPVVAMLEGDTSGIVAGPSSYLGNPGTATLIIGGVGTATFTDPMAIFSTYLGNLAGCGKSAKFGKEKLAA